MVLTCSAGAGCATMIVAIALQFYFAGHGFQRDNTEMMVLTDADILEAREVEDILQADFNGHKTWRNLLIVDSCRTDSHARAESCRAGQQPKPGFAHLFACAPEQIGAESRTCHADQGCFTYHFIEGLRDKIQRNQSIRTFFGQVKDQMGLAHMLEQAKSERTWQAAGVNQVTGEEVLFYNQ